MDERVKALAEELLDSGVEGLSSRERRLIVRIAKRHHVARNVVHMEEERRTRGERWADAIAEWGGSWTFVSSFLIFLLIWCVWNAVIAPEAARFDVYPFIFLNLVLSMLAAIQAPVIMMSQNRQAKVDRAQSTQDYEVNLKAELEIMALHDKIDRLTTLMEEKAAPAG